VKRFGSRRLDGLKDAELLAALDKAQVHDSRGFMADAFAAHEILLETNRRRTAREARPALQSEALRHTKTVLASSPAPELANRLIALWPPRIQRALRARYFPEQIAT